MDRAEVLVPIVIFIIVFVRIILSSVRTSSKKDKPVKTTQLQSGTQTTAQPQPNKPKPGTKAARPNRPKRGSRLAKPNKPSRGSGLAKLNKTARGTRTAKPNTPVYDRPLEERLAEYKKSRQSAGSNSIPKNNIPHRDSAAARPQPVQADTILDAARANTIEVEHDNDHDAIVTANLMDQVYEVMVKGPDDSLKFQRDFVAEGMEMLNRISIPD